MAPPAILPGTRPLHPGLKSSARRPTAEAATAAERAESPKGLPMPWRPACLPGLETGCLLLHYGSFISGQLYASQTGTETERGWKEETTSNSLKPQSRTKTASNTFFTCRVNTAFCPATHAICNSHCASTDIADKVSVLPSIVDLHANISTDRHWCSRACTRRNIQAHLHLHSAPCLGVASS